MWVLHFAMHLIRDGRRECNIAFCGTWLSTQSTYLFWLWFIKSFSLSLAYSQGRLAQRVLPVHKKYTQQRPSSYATMCLYLVLYMLYVHMLLYVWLWVHAGLMFHTINQFFFSAQSANEDMGSIIAANARGPNVGQYTPGRARREHNNKNTQKA